MNLGLIRDLTNCVRVDGLICSVTRLTISRPSLFIVYLILIHSPMPSRLWQGRRSNPGPYVDHRSSDFVNPVRLYPTLQQLKILRLLCRSDLITVLHSRVSSSAPLLARRRLRNAPVWMCTSFYLVFITFR